jgi:hypothetical protein
MGELLQNQEPEALEMRERIARPLGPKADRGRNPEIESIAVIVRGPAIRKSLHQVPKIVPHDVEIEMMGMTESIKSKLP